MMKLRLSIALALMAFLISEIAFAESMQNRKDPLEITYIKKEITKPDKQFQEKLRKSDSWQKFLKDHKKWYVEFNEATQKPHRAYGKSIQAQGETPQFTAKNFIETHLRDWVLPSYDLKFQSQTASSKYYNIFYSQTYNGLEILNSRVVVKMTNSLRVTMWGTDVFDVSISTIPALDINNAKIKSKADIGDEVTEVSSPELKILPVPNEKKIVFHLVYEVIVSSVNKEKIPSRYYTLVDANTGEILYRQNKVNFFQPLNSDVTVASKVFLRHPFIPKKIMPLRNLKVDVGGTIYYTDSVGNISLTGTNPISATFTLEGLWSKIITDGGTISPSLTRMFGAGADSLNFDSTTTIRHTSGYFHVNNIHDFMKNYFPSFTGLDFPLPTNIDVTGGSCNAFYDGSSINFYATGNGCNCLSQVADVVYHEYAHGINDLFYQSQGGGFDNGAMGEGYADIWALSLTKSPILAIGFDSSDPNYYLRRYDINRKVYPQDLIGEVHADGEIIAGAWYDVSLKLGSWSLMTNLFAQTFYDLITGPDGSEGQVFPEILLAALLEDDDDADISNGTPNDNKIIEAFALHGIYLLNNASFDHDQILSASAVQPINIYATITSQLPWFQTDLVLHYKTDFSSPYTTMPMTLDSANVYSAIIPQQPAGTLISYFLTLIDSSKTLQAIPEKADLLSPNIPYFILVDCIRDKIEDFDANQSSGWQTGLVEDSATGGKWIIGKPVVSFRSGDTCQAGVQHTPGGINCAITGNAASPSSANYSADVDNGKTTLQSPVIDLTNTTDPIITYWRWYTNDQGTNPSEDFWKTYISADGINFIKVENVDVADHSWRRFALKVADYFPSATAITLRFVADDSIHSSVVEVALDDIEVYSKDIGSGISQINPENYLSLYPNPASSFLTFDLDMNHSENLSVDIINNLGQIVLAHPFSLFAGKNRKNIDIHSLENGIYHFVINHRDGKMEKTFTVFR